MSEDKITVDSLIANERFQSYCLHTTEKETAYWEAWARENVVSQELIREAKTIVLALAVELSEEEIAQEFTQFKEQINKQKTPAAKLVALSSTSKTISLRRKWLGIMALGLLILIVAGSVNFFTKAQVTPIVWSTDFGEIQTKILPDGSKVILNSNSELRFEKEWTAHKTRLVQLQGEAFFEIAKQTTHNDFVVQTAKGAIQVLGTSFNVSQRADLLEVALLEGEVALRVPDQLVRYMQPGEIARLHADQTITQKTADVDVFSAWRFQRMIFRDVSIKVLTQRLLLEFDIKVEVKNPNLLHRKINASVPKNDPLLLLKALSELYDVKVQQVDKKSFLIE